MAAFRVLGSEPICPECSGFFALTVVEGSWGPIVRAQCQTCHQVKLPYEGPGAREAVFASRRAALNNQPSEEGRVNRLRRRRELRFRRRLRVTGAGLEHHVGFTQDVSEAGLFVATNRLPTKMELIALTVELPSGQLIQLNGRVKWLRDPPQLLATVSRRGFGVLLSDAPPEWTTFVSSLKGKRTA